jgi:hypothetical protein
MTVAMLRRNGWVLAAAVASLVFTVQPFGDSDVWWHLAVGHYILAHGIPATEPFSFLHAANPWAGQQWLYDTALARAVDLGGAGLASLLMGLVGSAALLTAALAIPPERRPPGPVLAVSLLLGAAVASQLLGVRGQVWSLLGAAVVLHVMMRWRRGSPRALLVLPPLLALWVNLDSGFVVGLGIAVIALLTVRGADRRSRRLLAGAIAGAALATLINPAGLGLWGYAAAALTTPTSTGVGSVWQSPDFHDLWLRLFEAQAILLVIAWVLARRRDLFDMVLAGAAFAASLQAQQNLALFAVIALPQLAVYGSAAWLAHRDRLPEVARGSRRRRPPGWLAAALAALVAAGAIAVVVPQLTAAGAARFEASHEPRAAADYASAHLAGHRLYTVDTWGGYLADRFPGGRVVFLYDEAAVFGSAAIERYLDIHDLRADWSTVLAGAGVADAILPSRAQEVAALLTLGWSVDCRDTTSASVVMSLGRGGAGSAPGPAPPCA